MFAAEHRPGRKRCLLCDADCAAANIPADFLAARVITGGGAIQLIMPQIYDGLLKHHPSFIAWRWALFVI